MNRNAQIAILDENGREREKYSIIYGAKLKVEDGQRVKSGDLIAEWDPFSTPILTELAGRFKFATCLRA